MTGKTKTAAGKLKELEAFAIERGCYRARAFPARDVVVDERVRLKCEIPLCPHFGHCLTCPPAAPSVEEFRKILKLYKKALMVQTRSSITGDMGTAVREDVLRYIAEPGVTKKHAKTEEWVYSDISDMKVAAINLHKIVNEVEGRAMEMGYHYATGLIGGECMLCAVCVGQGSGEKCRFPYQARPSMEGVGIDVVRTSGKAGLPFEIPPRTEIIWSGLILVD